MVVEAFSAKCADHSLDDRIRPRRSNGCGDGIDTDPSGSLTEVTAIHRIPISKEVTWFVSPGRRLDQLAPDPGGSRIGRHVDVHQLTPLMRDEDQHVQRLEGEGLHGQQVYRPEVVGVVGQERAPGLA